MTRLSIMCGIVMNLGMLGVTGAGMSASTSPTLELDKPIYFLSADEAPLVVAPGIYQVEAADPWLKLIPEGGAHNEAMLIAANPGTHEDEVATAQALIAPSEEQPDLQQLMLILPDGTGLAAVGSTTGIWPRGGEWTYHPPTAPTGTLATTHLPRGRFTTPTHEAAVRGQVRIEVAATATYGVDHVEIKVDGDASVCSLERHAPYDCHWDTTTAFDGRHTLRAVITDKKNKRRHIAVFVNVCNESCKVSLRNSQ